jgi:hypothetical protein
MSKITARTSVLVGVAGLWLLRGTQHPGPQLTQMVEGVFPTTVPTRKGASR